MRKAAGPMLPATTPAPHQPRVIASHPGERPGKEPVALPVTGRPGFRMTSPLGWLSGWRTRNALPGLGRSVAGRT
jgi:hypothetical protein